MNDKAFGIVSFAIGTVILGIIISAEARLSTSISIAGAAVSLGLVSAGLASFSFSEISNKIDDLKKEIDDLKTEIKSLSNSNEKNYKQDHSENPEAIEELYRESGKIGRHNQLLAFREFYLSLIFLVLLIGLFSWMEEPLFRSIISFVGFSVFAILSVSIYKCRHVRDEAWKKAEELEEHLGKGPTQKINQESEKDWVRKKIPVTKMMQKFVIVVSFAWFLSFIYFILRFLTTYIAL